MKNLIEMKGIYKDFPGVKVLKNVDFCVKHGEIHALLGENGAGKSTLMKILGGVHNHEKGDIYFDGVLINKMTPKIASELGIAFVHQELNLCDSLNVAENIHIGRLPLNKYGVVDFEKLYYDTNIVLKRLGTKFDARTIVGSLSTANKQLVEIAKAVSLNAKVIIFDEPTTSLSDKDVDSLFNIIMSLKIIGVSIIYISHRMKEIFELCDRATILRDGVFIETINVKKVSEDSIIKLMVGRELTSLYPTRNTKFGDCVLEADQLVAINSKYNPASFKLYKGEILGFFGLVGSGRTELLRLLFGADSLKSGKIIINGKKANINSPIDAISNKIALLTEDRKNQGLLLGMSISDNINVTNIKNIIIDNKYFNENSNKFISKLKIKTSSSKTKSGLLSGGNQQKVVLAKWLNTDSEIFIFDEPTKGIDVGAKAEIYLIMNELIAQGKSIIMISSEMPELIGMSDRIYVMCEGNITNNLNISDVTPEKIMKYATLGGTL